MVELVSKYSGLLLVFKIYLNDPVNWVKFIKENSFDRQEQKWWRDHLILDHIFDDEFEA